MSNANSLKNLKRGNPAGQFTSETARECARKSAEVRRKKAEEKKKLAENQKDFRGSVQKVLCGTYKKGGKELSGLDLKAAVLFDIATDPKNKQCLAAQRYIDQLMGYDLNEDDKKKIKNALTLQEKEIKLLQKKIDAIDEDW